MRTTGDICEASGIYGSGCCKFLVCRLAGEVFERCRTCSEEASWELIASAVPIQSSASRP